jgi:hypothetical protein
MGARFALTCLGHDSRRWLKGPVIVVVKKTFRYATVFLYNSLYRPSGLRNLFLKSGIHRLPPGDSDAVDFALENGYLFA